MKQLLITSLLIASFVSGAYAQPEKDVSHTQQGESAMSFVLGFGGFFFRAENPKALQQWYHENLGINLPPKSYDDQVWRQEAGATIFHAFDKDTDYFGSPEKQFMLNFRVRDLDTLVDHLRKNGNKVEVDPQIYPNGRFARTSDLEGNPIQLWAPGEENPE